MDDLEKELQGEELDDLFETYNQIESLLEELNNNIKELPEKEKI